MLFSAVCLFFLLSAFFFFNDTATTEIYTLSLHDALPISKDAKLYIGLLDGAREREKEITTTRGQSLRSEEHTSELQSQSNLVCRLLLEKKKKSTSSLRMHNTQSRQNGATRVPGTQACVYS